MSEITTLYDTDFVLWLKQQAEALRAAAGGATNQPIDWENVAEEIDSLARSEKRELKSQIRRIIEHLLKLEYSRAAGPRAGWIESIDDARNEIEAVIEDSPSLQTEIAGAIAAELRRGSRRAIRELRKYRELDPATVARIDATSYTEDQILGEWLPENSNRPQGEAQ
jgi:sugar-specific transcriptional regulator TrmB